jgi:hypothetical protein
MAAAIFRNNNHTVHIIIQYQKQQTESIAESEQLKIAA